MIRWLGQRSVLPSLLVGIATGAALAYHFFPRTVIQREVVVEEKVVNKVQTVEKVRVETKKPDGTTIVVTKDRVKDENTVSEVDKRIGEKLTLRPPGPRYGVSVLAGTSLRNVGSLSYGLQLEARLVGPLWISVFGLSDLSGGVGIGFKF